MTVVDTDPTAPVEAGAVGSPGARWRGWRWIGVVVVAPVVILVIYLAVTTVQVWSTGRSSPAVDADAIVVLGAAQYDGRPSAQLAARLDEVVRIWPEGRAPVVVVTGGRQPGDRFSEAEASARYLVERGVPESAIVFENEGSTTYESLSSAATILGPGTRVILVTDPFHALRSRLIAEEVGLRATVAPTRTSVISGWDDLGLHLREAAGIGVGRLIGFDRLEEITG